MIVGTCVFAGYLRGLPHHDARFTLKYPRAAAGFGAHARDGNVQRHAQGSGAK
jgi:hypothetical protein